MNQPLAPPIWVNENEALLLIHGIKIETVQDEVTSYVVGTITEQTDSKSEGGKKVIGKSGDGIGFLPNTLIEWLALIAILFIIGILGRSLYVAYKGDNNNNHH